VVKEELRVDLVEGFLHPQVGYNKLSSPQVSRNFSDRTVKLSSSLKLEGAFGQRKLTGNSLSLSLSETSCKAPSTFMKQECLAVVSRNI